MSSAGDKPQARARALPRAARLRLIAARLCADRESRRRLVGMLGAGTSARSSEPVPIRLRALDGDAVGIRPGTTDPEVLIGAFFGRYHLPGAPLNEPRLIWDLGANIGLTMLQMATQFPAARVVGVELDPGNIALAERNLARVAERVEVVEGAVWPDAGRLEYGAPEGDGVDAFRVGESGGGSVAAVTLESLRERFGTPDYVKMDIEGAESEVLSRNTSWIEGVSRMGVEYHGAYSRERCLTDLTGFGFSRFEDNKRGLLRRGSDSLFASRAEPA